MATCSYYTTGAVFPKSRQNNLLLVEVLPRRIVSISGVEKILQVLCN